MAHNKLTYQGQAETVLPTMYYPHYTPSSYGFNTPQHNYSVLHGDDQVMALKQQLEMVNYQLEITQKKLKEKETDIAIHQQVNNFLSTLITPQNKIT